MYPIITISRQVGSGGHAIGEKVAEMLGIPLIDRDFLEAVAEKTGLDKDVIAKKGEYASKIDKYLDYNFNMGLYTGGEQDEIYQAQAKVVMEYAWKGPCVIVGRCADYILESANVRSLNVFIHADMEHRKENLLSKGVDVDGSAEKYLDKKDKGRKYFYKYYTNREWGVVSNYELCLDCGKLGVDLCADFIAQAAKAMDDGK